MKHVKLNDVCEINIGKTPSRYESSYWDNGEYPWISIADMKTKYIGETKEQISSVAVKECNMKVIPRDTLIMSFKLSLGKLAITKEDMYSNEAIANFPIIDKPKLYINYLYYALQTLNLSQSSDRAVMGATLNKAKLNEIQIPLPPLDIQKKIADTLDKAQELIDKRKEQISALDKFLENLFLDMFGDPVSNPMGWETKELGTLGYFKNGMNYNQSDKGFSMKFLGVGEFKYGNILKTTEFLPMLELLSEPNEEYLLRNGDIVFVRSNGSKELVGRSILVKNIDEKTSYSGFCIRYRNESTLIIADFLINIFANENYKTYLKKDSRGANINNLNQQMLSNLNIIIPPLDLQNQFAFIVEKVEAEKTKLEDSLKEMEDNFNSIMQRAFKGELF